jgi:16S rRNA (uracil1498-N3)-methyltransferase
MRKLRFLVAPGALNAGAGALVDLPEEEARHLAVTLRAQPGFQVQIFDGEGPEWSAEVVEARRASVRVRLLSPETDPVESPLRVVVYQALSIDRVFEESIEPLVALGVTAIVPLLTERARTGGRPPDAKRLARWRRIAAEASKLSFRRVIPVIGQPLDVEGLAALPSAGARFLLDPDAPAGSLRSAISGPPPAEAGLVVGPEGGFTAEEISCLTATRFTPVRLGPRVLRTQHAGAAALAILLAAWSDIG